MLQGRTLWELLDERVELTPDDLMAVDEDMRTITFAEYRAEAERTATGLRALGLRRGDVVSWQLPTWIESLVLVGALSRVDAVQNPLVPIHREREVGLRHPPGGHPDTGGAVGVERLRLRGDGRAPGPIAAAARGMCERMAITGTDRNALVFPFTHIGGITWLVAGLQTGCANLLMESFHPDRNPEVLGRGHVTLAGAGTAFHQAYLAHQRRGAGAPWCRPPRASRRSPSRRWCSTCRLPDR